MSHTRRAIRVTIDEALLMLALLRRGSRAITAALLALCGCDEDAGVHVVITFADANLADAFDPHRPYDHVSIVASSDGGVDAVACFLPSDFIPEEAAFAPNEPNRCADMGAQHVRSSGLAPMTQIDGSMPNPTWDLGRSRSVNFAGTTGDTLTVTAQAGFGSTGELLLAAAAQGSAEAGFPELVVELARNPEAPVVLGGECSFLLVDDFNVLHPVCSQRTMNGNMVEPVECPLRAPVQSEDAFGPATQPLVPGCRFQPGGKHCQSPMLADGSDADLVYRGGSIIVPDFVPGDPPYGTARVLVSGRFARCAEGSGSECAVTVACDREKAPVRLGLAVQPTMEQPAYLQVRDISCLPSTAGPIAFRLDFDLMSIGHYAFAVVQQPSADPEACFFDLIDYDFEAEGLMVF